jgi:integrase
VLRVAGLPRFRLYDLRHTFATHLLAQGAPITHAAAQLGHAKPTTTLTYYAHWLPSGDVGYIDRLEALRIASGSKQRRRGVSWKCVNLNGAGGGT